MDWQQIASLGIVAAAAGFLVRRFLPPQLGRRRRVWRHHRGCGCPAGGSGAQPGSIVYRARKGQRPTIVIRPG